MNTDEVKYVLVKSVIGGGRKHDQTNLRNCVSNKVPPLSPDHCCSLDHGILKPVPTSPPFSLRRRPSGLSMVRGVLINPHKCRRVRHRLHTSIPDLAPTRPWRRARRAV
eukprot:scaffold7419_cov31-Tisochrysis_lutea.AAC.8